MDFCLLYREFWRQCIFRGYPLICKMHASISHPSSNIYVIYHCPSESSYIFRVPDRFVARENHSSIVESSKSGVWIPARRSRQGKMPINECATCARHASLCVQHSISRIFSLASPTDFMRSILRRKNDLPVYFSLWNSLAEVCFWRSNATEICENRFIDSVFV